MRASVFATRTERASAWISEHGQLVTTLALVCAILLAVGSAIAWHRARAHARQAQLARTQYVGLALEAQRRIDSLAAGRWVQLGPHDVIIRRRIGR